MRTPRHLDRDIYAGLVDMKFKRPEDVKISKTRNQISKSVSKGQKAGRAAAKARVARKKL